MPTPKLFYGTRGSTGFLEVGRGYKDRGVQYQMYAKTNRYAPAGPSGECIFPTLYAIVTFTESMFLYLTPFVDGVALGLQYVQMIANASSSQQTRTFELGLGVPVVLNGVERSQQAPRGTWIQVLVETHFNDINNIANQLVIEGLEVEYEVVRETIQPGTGR
jgi:hypothetical protein